MAGKSEPTSFLPSLQAPVQLAAARLRRPRWEALLPRAEHWDLPTVVAGVLLDRVYQQLRGAPDDPGPAMAELMTGLWSLKAGNPDDAWQSVISQCLAHPVRTLMHQDPFTVRSFQKPRGYSGDAVMIDYIYTRTVPDNVSPMGDSIFRFNRDTPACAAVRGRRDRVATFIEDVCARVDRPHILSVASGHLREAVLAPSVRAGRVSEFVALDQDELSLAVVERESGPYGVTTICNSVKGLFRPPLAHHKFDLIYSTGLYDYLDDRIAAKLTHRMFEMLNPEGRVLVANFLPGIWGVGYMEAFMDWRLIYRDTSEMTALASTIPDSEIESMRTFVEDNENIIFLEIRKR